MSESEASYVCDSCGEDIVVPLDRTAGDAQQYIEDCPVCCCANVLQIQFFEDGSAEIRAELE